MSNAAKHLNVHGKGSVSSPKLKAPSCEIRWSQPDSRRLAFPDECLETTILFSTETHRDRTCELCVLGSRTANQRIRCPSTCNYNYQSLRILCTGCEEPAPHRKRKDSFAGRGFSLSLQCLCLRIQFFCILPKGKGGKGKKLLHHQKLRFLLTVCSITLCSLQGF